MKAIWVHTTILVLALGVTGAAADEATWSWSEPERDETAKSSDEPNVFLLATQNAKSEEGKDVRVYTNADLLKMYGEPSESPPVTVSEETLAPLERMEREKEVAAERAKTRAEAEAEVAEARERLKNLNIQLLATRNYLSRRPKLSEEEKEYRQATKETAAERYDRTKKLVEEAEQELRDAEAKLPG